MYLRCEHCFVLFSSGRSCKGRRKSLDGEDHIFPLHFQSRVQGRSESLSSILRWEAKGMRRRGRIDGEKWEKRACWKPKQKQAISSPLPPLVYPSGPSVSVVRLEGGSQIKRIPNKIQSYIPAWNSTVHNSAYNLFVFGIKKNYHHFQKGKFSTAKTSERKKNQSNYCRVTFKSSQFLANTQ